MKHKKHFFLSVLIFLFGVISAQVPQGFNYQAIARDGHGEILADIELPVRIGILQGFTRQKLLWLEEHRNTITNQFGLFVLTIGDPAALKIDGSAAAFNEIDWTAQPLFLSTSIYFRGSWVDMGQSRLWTVPYAMVSGNLNGTLKKLAVKGTTSEMEEPLFEVRNNVGQLVFAVYNEGVRVHVADGDAKGAKGGFAVGGFGTDKAGEQTYLKVTADSTRIYVNDNPLKGSKGGFAVGGFDPSKAITPNFMKIHRDNYFIGHETGKSITSGKNNMFFGYQAGLNNTTGNRNIFIGEMSGRDNLYGYDNVFLGYNAGLSNLGTTWSDQGSQNVYIGVNSGKSATLGVANTFVGANSGASSTSSVSNTFIGSRAGASSLNVSDNTFIGSNSGYSNSTGNGNINIGTSAGYYMSSASYNIIIGNEAAYYLGFGQDNVVVGSRAARDMRENRNTVIGNGAGYSLRWSTGNVLLGYNAGYYETGNNKLYIENSNATVPLIGGDFSTDRVGINRMPTTYTLEVGGTIWANGSTISNGSSTWSDARYKTDIRQLGNALASVMQISGVSYNWNRSAFPDLNFPEGQQIGVIAQEVEQILPQVVITGPDGYKSVSYEKLTPILIEAVKEQQKEITDLKNELAEMKELLKKNGIK